MRTLPGRIAAVARSKRITLTKIAERESIQLCNLSLVISGKRKKSKHNSVLEKYFGMPIEEIRRIYQEDKNRKVSRQEGLSFLLGGKNA